MRRTSDVITAAAQRPLIGTSEYYGADRVVEIRLLLRSRSGLIAIESQVAPH